MFETNREKFKIKFCRQRAQFDFGRDVKQIAFTRHAFQSHASPDNKIISFPLISS